MRHSTAEQLPIINASTKRTFDKFFCNDYIDNMKVTVKKVRENALALSSAERASLIHDLIVSLDDESSFDLTPEYEAEIKRRVKSVKEGKAVGQSAESVFLEIEKKFLNSGQKE